MSNPRHRMERAPYASNGRYGSGPGTKKAFVKGESPGLPWNSYTFSTVEEDEVALAGYLGFISTIYLRKLVFAWPVVKAFQAFGPVSCSKYLRKGGVYNMIKESEESIVDKDLGEVMRDAQAPLAEVQRYVAWILLHLEADLIQYYRNDGLINRRLNEEYFPLARQVYNKTPSRVIDAPAPFMNMFEGEHRLERINRCWNLLKHISFLHKKGLWDRRMGTEEAIQDGEPLMEREFPKWIQTPPTSV